MWTSPINAYIPEETSHRQPCIVRYSTAWRSANKNLFFNTALVHFLPHRMYCIYTHVNIICAIHQVRWNLSTFSHFVTVTHFFNIILPSMCRFSHYCFHSDYLTWEKWLMVHAFYNHSLSNPPWFGHPNTIFLRECIVNILSACIFCLLLRCFIHFLV